MYKNYTDEEILQAKETSLTELAAHYGYHPIRVGNLYSLKEHDSVRIYNDRTWYRWSRAGNGKDSGGSQIDFLIQFCGVESVAEAIQRLLEFQGVYRISSLERERGEVQALFRIKRSRWKRKKERIYSSRRCTGGLSASIRIFNKDKRTVSVFVDYFVKDLKILYEESEHHNLVFLGKDKEGVVRYATERGTADIYGKKYRGDVAGNDKNFGINIVNAESDELKVFEANIDLMSYMDVTGDYSSNKLVLGMTADNPLIQFLKDYQHIKRIGFCLDNHAAGMRAMYGESEKKLGGQEKEGLLKKYADMGYETYTDIVPSQSGCKDWNEYFNT